jgi:hypothetical protein
MVSWQFLPWVRICVFYVLGRTPKPSHLWLMDRAAREALRHSIQPSTYSDFLKVLAFVFFYTSFIHSTLELQLP